MREIFVVLWGVRVMGNKIFDWEIFFKISSNFHQLIINCVCKTNMDSITLISCHHSLAP